jgi:endo-1,4-beta-mannosidase
VNQFPEAIIQEEKFKLEEKVIGDKEKYLEDLIKSYKKEQHKEDLMKLQQKLREDGSDHEALLKEIYDHVKKGSETA